MYILLAVSLFGSGAISIVWLRMEISATAKNCGKLEDQREMVARELRELRGKKSSMLRPSMIAKLVEGRLSVPTAKKTIYVTKREMNSLMHSEIARRNVTSEEKFLTQR